MNIKVVTHYSKNDSECRGDYYLVTIEKNGKVIQSYGDYYHDKGHLKAEAFLDAMRYFNIEFELEEVDVPDMDIDD